LGTSQLNYAFSGLKSAMVGLFTLQKLANAINTHFFHVH
jgi:hypothetical protein